MTKEELYNAELAEIEKLCRKHGLRLHKHDRNYINAKWICVLSENLAERGLSLKTIEDEETRTTRRAYLSPAEYALFIIKTGWRH